MGVWSPRRVPIEGFTLDDPPSPSFLALCLASHIRGRGGGGAQTGVVR
jgi:hypothetical protein